MEPSVDHFIPHRHRPLSKQGQERRGSARRLRRGASYAAPAPARRGGSCAAAVALRGEAKDGLHGAAWGCTLARTPAGRRERVSRPACAVLR